MYCSTTFLVFLHGWVVKQKGKFTLTALLFLPTATAIAIMNIKI